MEVRWSRAGGVFVDVKWRGPSRREILRQDAAAGCALHAGTTLHSLREGTRSRIISSAHPGDAVDVGQRGAVSTSAEDERDDRAATCS